MHRGHNLPLNLKPKGWLKGYKVGSLAYTLQIQKDQQVATLPAKGWIDMSDRLMPTTEEYFWLCHLLHLSFPLSGIWMQNMKTIVNFHCHVFKKGWNYTGQNDSLEKGSWCVHHAIQHNRNHFIVFLVLYWNARNDFHTMLNNLNRPQGWAPFPNHPAAYSVPSKSALE